MYVSHASYPLHLTLRLWPSVTLATMMLAGCACDDAYWEADIASETEAAEYYGTSDCNLDRLTRLSPKVAEYAGRADPRILEIARLEAERDCYKSAAAKEREHHQSIE